ncbi:MAG TPA: glycosyltransferase [Candidatus Fimivivens sp.]|nr:glycosyltransferase [Candidatus Fimivivens sp.]
MKIAQIAPSFGLPGGPEIVCSHLTEALVESGADVTLFAPGDWKTSAKHVVTIPESLWNMSEFRQQTEIERRNLNLENLFRIVRDRDAFDIIHIHSQRYAASVCATVGKPCVVTLHNKIAARDFRQLQGVGAVPVAISGGRARGLDSVGIPVIRNGIPISGIKPSFANGDGLICIGRITEPKGIHTAIDIARAAGKRLHIYGRVGNAPGRLDYFEKRILPHIGDDILFHEQVQQDELLDAIRNAEALLSPIVGGLLTVPLVVMEALACGTPVIGTSINDPALFRDAGRIGVYSDDYDELVAAARNTSVFDRTDCRMFAERNFDSRLMAEKYLELYADVLGQTQENA